MISFTNLLKEAASDWKSSLFKNTKDNGGFFLSNDDIEDYFIELIESGFKITIDRKILYGKDSHNRPLFMSQKVDFLRHKCYPCYVITLKLQTGKSNYVPIFTDFEKKLNKLKLIISSYKAICVRIRLFHNIEISLNEISYATESCSFSLVLFEDSQIPRNFCEEKKIVINYRETILGTISNNKIFDVEIANAETEKPDIINVKLKDEYIELDGDKILRRMIQKYDILKGYNIKIERISDIEWNIITN